MNRATPSINDELRIEGTSTYPTRRGRVLLAGFLFVLVLGGFLRFEGAGSRSLWRDELCTWHVSRIPIGESLRWGPELTKPPLYQFALRVLSSDPQPSEAALRFPAVLCGALTLVAAFWLGWMGGGLQVGLALAVLLAFNALQIEYSREARPYTMLVLGCALSVPLWFRLVTTGRRRYLLAYVLTATLTLYAHYLAALTFVGQGVWWLVQLRRSPREVEDDDSSDQMLSPKGKRYVLAPVIAILLIGVFCIPLAVRYLKYKSSMFQGLEWIAPPTLHRSLGTLESLTYGWRWLYGMLATSLVVWLVTLSRWRPKRWTRLWAPGDAEPEAMTGLLIACLVGSWFGLLVISWIAHPAMVARYALPAAIPALLIPLMIAQRLHRRAPLVIALVFVVGSAPVWINRQANVGLREMSQYLIEHVDPNRELVVLTIDNTIYTGWEDSERLGFEYYPIPGLPVAELHLESDGVTARNDVLKDPRGLYLIVLWADELKIIEAAGRRIEPIKIDGIKLSRLLFEPYRLIRIAPL